MRNCLFNFNLTRDNVEVKALIQLAEEFGLPCIERDSYVSVVGLEQILEFKHELNFINLEEILHDY